MRARTALVMAVVAGALAAGAYLVLRRGEAPTRAPGASALPDLGARAGEIAAVEVLRANATIRLERTGAGAWVVASSDGYPARPEAVRALVAGLADLRLDAPMTARRERHGEIGLAWPDATGRARRVRLLTGAPGAAPAADIVLGDERGQPPAVFLRAFDDAQTWRARGRASAPTDAAEWMDRVIVALPAEALQSAALRGLTLTRAERPAPEAPAEAAPEAGAPPRATEWLASAAPEAAWTPEGIEVARGSLVGMLAHLEFDAVRRARVEAAPEARYSPVFQTGGGTVALLGHRESDGVWVRLRVEPGPEGDLVALAPRTEGWEYRLPPWIGEMFDRMAAPPRPAPPPSRPDASAPPRRVEDPEK
jgi:hypothetical protein